MGDTSEQTNRCFTNSHTHVRSTDADTSGRSAWEIFNWVATHWRNQCASRKALNRIRGPRVIRKR